MARVNPWGCVQRDLRRRRRRTASVERVTRVGVVRHRRCRKVVGITIPRVRPSGITRGYAWCVPSGDSECGLGGFFFLSLSTSPRVHPSGITRGYAWCVPSGDSGYGLGGFSFLSLSTLPLHFFTSPRVRLLGITPRLSMVCPLRGQWGRLSS